MNQETREPLLSSSQRRVVAYALTSLGALALAACALLIFWLLREAVVTFSDVIWPLAVSGILAMLLRPLAEGLQYRFRLGRTGSILTLYLLVILACAGIAAYVVPVIVEQLLELLRFQGDMVREVLGRIQQDYPELMSRLREFISIEELKAYGEKALQGVQGMIAASLPALERAGEALTSILTTATGLAIIPVYLFYFLDSKLDYREAIGKELTFINKDIREDLLFLVNEFVSILVAFFRGQIVIGLIMGVLLALGFTLAGLKFGIALGLLIGMLNIIPYLGTILGLGTALPIAWFQQPDGGPLLIGLVLAVFAIVQIIEGYLLTPRIMGKQTGMHPMVIIIAIFFWGTALNGILGMILAIPLTAFLIIAWRLARRKYLPLLTGHREQTEQL